MTTYLEPRDVPKHLIPYDYKGKKFRAITATKYTHNSHDGYWHGGSRKTATAIRLRDGFAFPLDDTSKHPLHNPSSSNTFDIKPGYAIREHSIFCGKDMGLTYYVHPQDTTLALPTPIPDLSSAELFVLHAIKSFKSADRYINAARDHRAPQPVPSIREYEVAKVTLANKGLLGGNGCLTTKGKNVIERIR